MLRKFYIAGLSLILLGGCAISTPFKWSIQTGPFDSLKTARPVLLVLTHAQLKPSIPQRFRFFKHVRMVEDSLPGQKGFIGYSKRMHMLGGEAWTLTIWENENDMRAFKTNEVHAQAMAKASGAMKGARFKRIWLPIDQLPQSWDGILALFDDDQNQSNSSRY